MSDKFKKALDYLKQLRLITLNRPLRTLLNLSLLIFKKLKEYSYVKLLTISSWRKSNFSKYIYYIFIIGAREIYKRFDLHCYIETKKGKNLYVHDWLIWKNAFLKSPLNILKLYQQIVSEKNAILYIKNLKIEDWCKPQRLLWSSSHPFGLGSFETSPN